MRNRQPPLRRLSFADLALPALPRHAVLSHQSAALLERLPLIERHLPAITLPVGFHARRCAGWQVHWADLGPDDVTTTSDGVLVTTPRRTIIDCCSCLPFYEAVAVLDAGLNRGLITLEDITQVAAAARGRHSGAIKAAVRWCDGRAESAQESVARVGLQQAGLLCEPQFRLFDGDYAHRFDLGLRWARLLVDLQSKAHHSAWPEVERDIGYLELVNLTKGWRLALTTPTQVLPRPDRFVRHIMGIVVNQPSARSRAIRRRYVADGVVIWPERADR